VKFLPVIDDIGLASPPLPAEVPKAVPFLPALVPRGPLAPNAFCYREKCLKFEGKS